MGKKKKEVMAVGFPERVSIKRRSLSVKGSLTFNEWLDVGYLLKDIHGSIMFWLGDWLNYGENRYGETYAQAVEVSGYSPQTLADAKWVASRIKPSFRNETLSFAHHRAVAPLNQKDQSKWLKKAQADKLTSSVLRLAVRGEPEPKPGGPAAELLTTMTCPHCKKEFEL